MRSSRTARADDSETLFAKAVELEARGRDEEAQATYIEVVRRNGAHFGALINLGNLLNRRGYRSAARLTYAEAAKVQPQNPVVDVNLGNTFLDTNEFETAREHFERALGKDAGLPEAHQGMSYAYARLGDEASASRHRDLGFAPRAVTVFPYRGDGAPIRVLLFASALGGNVGTTEFLDDRTFAVTRVFAEYAEQVSLDSFDLVFNAVGDADRCGAALQAAAALFERAAIPVINAPQAVSQTTRASAYASLRVLTGLRIARCVTVNRAALAGSAFGVLRREGFEPPVLLRVPGFHAGMFFERAENDEDVAAISSRFPGKEVSLIEPIDVRSKDGNYRKYRVIFVDGELYPLHLAISGHWKVHYFTSDTAAVAAHREEEASFLSDMQCVLGEPAIFVLRALAKRLNLDYAGVDFALDARGNVVVFEANATMIVPPRETNPDLAYRVPHAQRTLTAVREMLLRRAGRCTA